MSQREPTIASILRELASAYSGVVPEREVFDRVLERRPSKAKNPYASIRQQIRYNAPRLGWIWLGRGDLMPLRAALEGLRFRLVPGDLELTSRAILRGSMRPFVPLTLASEAISIYDERSRRIASRAQTISVLEGEFGVLDAPALGLDSWFDRVRFAPGDSILVTIERFDPLTLRIEHERAAAFRADDVAARDADLLEQLTAFVAERPRDLIFPEESVLPIYARAPWRTAYPGRPWQQLVVSDDRLRLVDGQHIADVHYRSPWDSLFNAEQDEQHWERSDAQMLEQIAHFQDELLRSRREDARRALWNGIAPRASTARVIYDIRAGTSETIYLGAVNMLQDHSADIEEHIARGEFQQHGWEIDDENEPFDLADDLDMPDEWLEVDDIDDLESFVEQNPQLADAARQLMESLSDEEIEQLEEATSLEDVQRILSSRLTDLMRTNPSLFVPLDIQPAASSANGTNGYANGHANGSGHTYDEKGFWLNIDEAMEFAGDDDQWMIDAFQKDGAEEENEASELDIDEALIRSHELMEQFYQYQIAQGKSTSTAEHRTSDLWVYAEFLSSYYGRSLNAGDYATLDECLFFFYPRKIINSTPRAAREMCTSLKQFYAFLKAQGIITDDRFAVAIWRRREQAARVVELYDLLDSESPQFDRLFARLFAPYTA